MRRLAVAPRLDWRQHVERDLGFAFHTINDAPYWDETACYAFTEEQVDELEAATGALEQMALELVDRVVRAGDAAYQRLRIPPTAWAAIERSWWAADKNLFGRFDLRYDGERPPKLLEYNADTPTALFEAAVVQWDWLEALWPGRDQFNSLHERLIEAWRNFGLGRTRVYFSAVKNHAEDGGTVDYLRDTAIQAGLDTAAIAIEDIGWDGARFLDLDNQPIEALFKLYPWEWLVGETFGAALANLDLVLPDGIGIVWALRQLTGVRAARISFDATSLYHPVFRHLQSIRCPVFIIGGRPGVAAKAAERMQTIYPTLNVVGVMHGYQSRAHSVRTIKGSGARFVLCGMGAPNQERMLMALKQAGFSGSAFSCGGFLDQVVEKKEYYPRWVDRLEVRCLYRLAREPRRLCRRYLYEYQAFMRQFLQTMLTRPPRSARTDESP